MMSIIIASHNEPRVDEVYKTCQELFPMARLVIAHDHEGIGKGHAHIEGLKLDRRFLPRREDDTVVFIDGDMDIHPRMIRRLLPFIEDFEIVVGSKPIGPLPLRRKLLTLASRIVIKLMFWLDVDTQTGIKLFRQSSVPGWDEKGFIFDVEVLCKCKAAGMRIIEVPIEVNIYKQKSMGVIWKAFLATLRVWFRLLCPHDNTKI
jgi:hypothetical protein